LIKFVQECLAFLGILKVSQFTTPALQQLQNDHTHQNPVGVSSIKKYIRAHSDTTRKKPWRSIYDTTSHHGLHRPLQCQPTCPLYLGLQKCPAKRTLPAHDLPHTQDGADTDLPDGLKMNRNSEDINQFKGENAGAHLASTVVIAHVQ
jgi:hypothetical protein